MFTSYYSFVFFLKIQGQMKIISVGFAAAEDAADAGDAGTTHVIVPEINAIAVYTKPLK